MCNPIAIAGLSALGSVWQGYSASQAAKAQAEAAEQNAAISDARAHDAVTRGGEEEAKMRRRNSIIMGQQRAQAAASGLIADTGSAADIADTSMREMERDVSTNAMNAQRERWGYQVQAVNYRNQASAARAAGRNAMMGGIIGAGTSLLSLVNLGGAAPVSAAAASAGTDTFGKNISAAQSPYALPPGLDDGGSLYPYPIYNGRRRS